MPLSAIHIASASDALQLQTREGRAARAGREIALDASFMSHDVAREWERRINREINACGCETGGAFLIVGLGGLAFMGAIEWRQVLRSLPLAIVIGIAVLFVLAITGKTLGLVHAQWRLARLFSALAQQLQVLESTHTRAA